MALVTGFNKRCSHKNIPQNSLSLDKYPFETYLKIKLRETSFAHNIFPHLLNRYKERFEHCQWCYGAATFVRFKFHYHDVIMDAIASHITSLTIAYSIVYSDVDQRKHRSSASLAFVRGIHRGPVNSPHKWPVTRKMFPFDDVIMFR